MKIDLKVLTYSEIKGPLWGWLGGLQVRCKQNPRSKWLRIYFNIFMIFINWIIRYQTDWMTLWKAFFFFFFLPNTAAEEQWLTDVTDWLSRWRRTSVKEQTEWDVSIRWGQEKSSRGREKKKNPTMPTFTPKVKWAIYVIYHDHPKKW